MPGAVLGELLARAESPSDPRGAYAGRGGRLHVDARVAYVERLFARCARDGEDLLDDGRIGFERHVGPLSEHRDEAGVGEEDPDQLLGARLKLVRGHGEVDAAPCQFGDRLRNACVGAGVAVDAVGVVPYEVGAHERHVFGRAQRLGQRPLHEAHDAVADERAVLFEGVLRKAAQRQCGVAGDGQIADRVEQRAVEVEDDESGFFHDRRITRVCRSAVCPIPLRR